MKLVWLFIAIVTYVANLGRGRLCSR